MSQLEIPLRSRGQVIGRYRVIAPDRTFAIIQARIRALIAGHHWLEVIRAERDPATADPVWDVVLRLHPDDLPASLCAAPIAELGRCARALGHPGRCATEDGELLGDPGE